jgi:hypothetical protein
MAKRAASKNLSPRTVMAVLGGLAVLIGLVVVLMWQANFLVGRSLLIAFGNGADSKYKGARFAWNGDLVAKDFELEPYGPEVDARLNFERVRVDTPGWLWVIKTLRGRKLVADTDRLHVILEGGTSNAGIDPSLGDLGPFGTDTASPFEAEGCMDDDVWVRSELVEMGLAPGPTTLEFDYQVKDRQLETRVVLETPGVSKVSLLRHEALSGAINPYLLDLMPTLATDEAWTVEDQGFVKARNAFCAKRDGITPEAFVSRHVAAVQRLLAIRGLSVDQESLSTYANFARNGGDIRFGGRYAMPVHSEIFYESRDSGEAFTQMHVVLERQRQKQAVSLARIAPRPLPGHDSLSTYAAMVKEGSAVGSPPAALPAAATAAAVQTTLVASDVGPATAPVATTTSSPASLPAAAMPPSASMAAVGDEVAWGELSKYRDREFEITTAHMGMRVVRLLDAATGEITVEGSVQGGRVTNRIHRDGFVRAVLIR